MSVYRMVERGNPILSLKLEGVSPDCDRESGGSTRACLCHV
jgi:hypothetical protein